MAPAWVRRRTSTHVPSPAGQTPVSRTDERLGNLYLWIKRNRLRARTVLESVQGSPRVLSPSLLSAGPSGPSPTRTEASASLAEQILYEICSLVDWPPEA
jgi:hypothetical protein